MIKISLFIVACVSLTIDGTHQPDHYKKDDKSINHYASVSYGKAYESKVQKTVKYLYPSTIYKKSTNKMYPSSYKHAYSKPVYVSKNQVYTPMINQYKPVYSQAHKTYKKTYVKPSSQYLHPYSSNYYSSKKDIIYKATDKNYKATPKYQQQYHQNYETGKDYKMNEYKKQDANMYDPKDYHKQMPVYNQKKVTPMHVTPKYQQQYHQNYETGKDYKMNEYKKQDANMYDPKDYHKQMPVYNQKDQKKNTYQKQYKPAYDSMKNIHYKMKDYEINKNNMKPYETYKSQQTKDNNQYGTMDHKVQEYMKYSNEKFDNGNEYVYKKKDMNGMNQQTYIKEYPMKTKYQTEPEMKSSYGSQYPTMYKSNKMYENDEKSESYKAYKSQNDYHKMEEQAKEYHQKKQDYSHDCYSSGMRPLPGDCYKFVMCNNGKRTVMKCPSNLVYDEHKKICNHRHMVKGKCGSTIYSY